MDFIVHFDEVYAPKLGIRAGTFRDIFVALLDRKKANFFIVETGTAREPGNWAGDGQSTCLFDCLVTELGGIVYSFDISEEACTMAHKITSDNVSVIQGDSIKSLMNYNFNVDLLYLDSFDLDVSNPHPAALHHLKELCAIIPRLADGTIVCVDDSPTGPDGKVQGKGMYVADFLDTVGCERITAGYQVAWRFKQWW